MADQDLTAITPLATLTGEELLYAVDDPSGTPADASITATVLREYTNMAQATASPTTADVTGAVNTLHLLDISGLTASRNFVLPAVAAVNDRVGVSITTGDDTYALILKADTGDSIIASTSTFTATEWTRLLMTGETVFFRCIVANSTWIVEYDGRIPIVARAISAGTGTVTQSITTATWTTLNANLYTTEEYDNSDSLGADGGSKMRFTARRAGQYYTGGACFQNCNSSGKILTGGAGKNGAASPEGRFMRLMTAAASGAYVASGLSQTTLAVGDYVNWYTYQDAGSNQNAADNVGSTYAFVQEILQ